MAMASIDAIANSDTAPPLCLSWIASGWYRCSDGCDLAVSDTVAEIETRGLSRVNRPWRPHSPVVLIAGTPAGGGQDRVARALATSLAPLLGVPIDVVNVPGRGGANGWDRLAGATKDSNLLSISSPTLITNRMVGAADIDHRSLTPIALLCTEHLAFAVADGSSIIDGTDLIGRLRSNDMLVTAFATAVGNINHMALARLASIAGGDPASLKTRVFDSAPEAVADLLIGNSDLAVVSAASVVNEVEGGLVRLVAVSSPVRLEGSLQTVPTWDEQAVPCTLGTWRGVVAPPGLTVDLIRNWEQAIMAATGSDEWRASLERHLWTPTILGSAATSAFHDQQAGVLSAALTDLGLVSAAHG
jgi:putative tricarboxylic transport membrane protein